MLCSVSMNWARCPRDIKTLLLHTELSYETLNLVAGTTSPDLSRQVRIGETIHDGTDFGEHGVMQESLSDIVDF